MTLTEKDKKYFYQKISTLRKGLQMLEEELGQEAPAPRVTQKSQFRQDFINMYKLGDRRVPSRFKVKTKSKKTGTNQ